MNAAEQEVDCFIPARNEAKAITRTLEHLVRSLSVCVRRFRILVVDDHSTDDTVARVEALGLLQVSVIRNARGPSFRENLAQAMVQSTAPIQMFLDADLTPGPATFAAVFDALNGGADLVVGNRYERGATVRRAVARRLLSHAYNVGVRAAFSSRVTDHQCGMKAFRGDVLRRLVSQMKPDPGFQRGWFWDAELLIRAQWAGCRIVEVPVAPDTRRDSRAQLTRQYTLLPWMLRLLAERP